MAAFGFSECCLEWHFPDLQVLSDSSHHVHMLTLERILSTISLEDVQHMPTMPYMLKLCLEM